MLLLRLSLCFVIVVASTKPITRKQVNDRVVIDSNGAVFFEANDEEVSVGSRSNLQFEHSAGTETSLQDDDDPSTPCPSTADSAATTVAASTTKPRDVLPTSQSPTITDYYFEKKSPNGYFGEELGGGCNQREEGEGWSPDECSQACLDYGAQCGGFEVHVPSKHQQPTQSQSSTAPPEPPNTDQEELAAHGELATHGHCYIFLRHRNVLEDIIKGDNDANCPWTPDANCQRYMRKGQPEPVGSLFTSGDQ